MSEKLANDAVVDRAIASIKGLRVDGGEVFLRDGQSTTVEVRDGAVENAITRGERGIGVRVLRGATLVGQGPKLMSEIDMVGSDLGYSVGTCGKDGQGAPVADAQPTLRIPSVVVGGKVKSA